jgi:hypothetical protein
MVIETWAATGRGKQGRALQFPLVEDLEIPPVQLIVGEMGIKLRRRCILVPGQLLGQLEIAAGTTQHCGDEIVAERVGGDAARSLFPKRFANY